MRAALQRAPRGAHRIRLCSAPSVLPSSSGGACSWRRFSAQAERLSSVSVGALLSTNTGQETPLPLETQATRVTSAARQQNSISIAAAVAPDLGLDDLIVTPAARRKLASLRSHAESKSAGASSNLALRVRVDGGGCSGFRYAFELESKGGPQPDDRMFSAPSDGGIPVLIDDVSLRLIKGSTLDFVDEIMKSTFAIVNNPQSDSSCGCGSSFSAKE